MVALCGQCHPMVAKWQRDRQYEVKRKPFNISNGMFSGALEFDKRDLVFKVGGNWYDNTPVILQFFNKPIIACSIEEGQAKVSLDLLDPSGRSLLKVVNNEITFRIDDFWDFEYAHNLAIARYGSRDIALRMDFRQPEAIIVGKIWLGEQKIILGKEETNLPNATLRGGRTSHCGVGIQIGDLISPPWPSPPQTDPQLKPRRNAPCPCRSGLRFKRCPPRSDPQNSHDFRTPPVRAA